MQSTALLYRWFYRLAPLLLFLLLSAGFVWQPILTGQVFLPTDLTYSQDAVWMIHHPHAGQVTGQNPLLSDVALYYYPYARYAMERLAAGHFPLWNPDILAGAPLFATTQAAILDPINLLTYLSGPLAYWTWAAWLRLALIGFTTYGFLRALGRSRAAAVGAGVVFMVCGYVAVWLNYSVVTTLAWMPALFWATTWLLRTERMVPLGATALAAGLLLLGGHPESQFLIILVWAIYSLYMLAVLRPQGPGWRAAVRRGAMITAAGLLGLALAAVQVVPFINYLLSSNATTERNVPVAPLNMSESALNLLVQLVPNFSGNPAEHNYWVSFTNFNQQTGYIGLLAVGLALAGAVYWFRRDRIAPLFAVLGLLALLLDIRAPGFHLIRALPVFNIGLGVRWTLLWSFCGAVLVGYGLDALPALGRRGRRLGMLGLAWTGTALLGAGLLYICYQGIRDGLWDRSWQPIAHHNRILGLFSPAHLTLYWPLIFLGLGGVVLLAGFVRPLGSRGLLSLLILLLYADLWVFGSQYNPVTTPAAIYPPNRLISYLQKQLGHDRIAAPQGVLWPNIAMVLGLRDLRGYEDIVPAPFQQVNDPPLRTLGQPIKQVHNLSVSDMHIFDAGGVRYILTLGRLQCDGVPQAYRWLFSDNGVSIYERQSALPRAYVVFSAAVVSDLHTAVRILRDPAHDPSRSVVLIGGGQPIAGPNLPVTAAPVSWQADDPERVALVARLPAPGYLVLSDSYTPDWVATVDGHPTPILQANGAYRAVALPAGPHNVEFSYRPWPVYTSATVSGGALLILALLVVGEKVIAYRGRRPLPVNAGSGARR